MIRPGAFNVLLSHNPDVFPVAARQGYGNDHRRPHARRPGPRRDSAPRPERRALFYSLRRRTVSPGSTPRFLFRAGLEPSESRRAWDAPRSGAIDACAVPDPQRHSREPGSADGRARGRAPAATTRFCAWAIWWATARIPTRSCEWARANVTAIVRGNHDRACCGNESLDDYQSCRALLRRCGRATR